MDIQNMRSNVNYYNLQGLQLPKVGHRNASNFLPKKPKIDKDYQTSER
jgi:hypothetical protein